MRQKRYSSSRVLSNKGRVKCLMVALSLVAMQAKAQVNVMVGNPASTSTSMNLPFSGANAFSYTQNLVLGADLITAGASTSPGGQIQKIRFFYNSGSLLNTDSFTVYIGKTVKTAFANSSDWYPTDSMTVVFTGTLAMPTGQGAWWEIPLSTPFNYTPSSTSNLVIAIDENRPGGAGTNNGGMWRISTFSAGHAIFTSGANDVNPASPPTGAITSTGNNIQFDILRPCVGTPNPGNTIVANTTICAGATPSVSLQNSYADSSGINYQWQMNIMSSGWFNVGWPNIPTFNQPSGINTSYRCILSCGTNTAVSNPVSVTVNQPPVVSVSSLPIALCSSNSATLSGSGALTYSWMPSAGLSATSGTSVTANPTAYTTYTVAGTDANNCTSNATVVVSPITAYKLSDMSSTSFGATCIQTGDQVSMDINTTIPSVVGPTSGNWEFQWYKGTAIVQAYSAFSSLNATETTPGVYDYKVTMRNTACPNDISDTGRVTVTVGAIATIDSIQINCNTPTGTLSMLDAFGQSAWDSVLVEDFALSPIANNATLNGVASVSNGRALLVNNILSQRGGLTVTSTNNANPLYKAITVDYKLTADMGVKFFGGTTAAEGTAWSYGDDAVYASSGIPENGFGTKLRLSFDVKNDVASNGNVAGVYLVYGWSNATTPYGPASSEVIAYSADLSSWDGKTDTPISISISESGSFNLTVGTTVIFANVQLPQAFVQADKTNWQHVFSARTNQDAMRFAIDDLKIRYKTALNYGITTAPVPTLPTTWQKNDGVFANLAAGTYNLWMNNPDDANCNTWIGSYTIHSTNPVVHLGNDTITCANSPLLLDAGASFQAYDWNSGAASTETLSVNSAGTYSVTVTDTDGCTGSDTIVVTMGTSPSATGVSGMILPSNSYSLNVANPQNVTSYDWQFGDGNIGTTTLASVIHTYNGNGAYTVTVTLNGQCGTQTFTTVANVTVGIDEVAAEAGIRMYPNPANNQLMINSENSEIQSISIIDVTGKLVYSNNAVSSTTTVDVTSLTNGVYTVSIATGKGLAHQRLVISH